MSELSDRQTSGACAWSRGRWGSVVANLSLRSQPCIGSALVTQARSTGPGIVEFRGRSGRRKLYWVGGETEMMEESADGAS